MVVSYTNNIIKEEITEFNLTSQHHHFLPDLFRKLKY